MTSRDLLATDPEGGFLRNLLAELPTIGASSPLKPQSSMSDLVSELQVSVSLVIADSRPEE